MHHTKLVFNAPAARVTRQKFAAVFDIGNLT